MQPRIRFFCFFAVLAWFSSPAIGQTTSADVMWHCWYDADGSFRVKCFNPEPGDPANQAFDALVSAGDLLGATRLVRQSPASFAGTMMYIPIYIHPMRGMAFVERLARAVMCHKSALTCAVAFDPEVPTLPAGAIPP